jgi:hypothetical protein
MDLPCRTLPVCGSYETSVSHADPLCVWRMMCLRRPRIAAVYSRSDTCSGEVCTRIMFGCQNVVVSSSLKLLGWQVR